MGFEYGASGATHYALEDVAALRTLTGLTIVIPASPAQAVTAIRDTHTLDGPIYYSLGKDDKTVVPGLGDRFELAKVQVIRNGGDVALVTMGSVSQEAVAAAVELSTKGVEAAVVVVSNFAPDPDAHLAEILAPFRHVVSVEAQTLSGGLGAFVATVLASHGLPGRLRLIGVRQPPDGTSGSQAERWRKHGLDRAGIAQQVLEAVRAV
jgi:transketolase